jgi:Papain family cysteine protease
MAFAASDTNSFAQGNPGYLSVEFAHFHAVRRRQPLQADRGVPMLLMVDAIREDGQPPEHIWPYLPALPSPISTWAPPLNCAPLFRHPMVIKTPEFSNIVAALNEGQPVLSATTISAQFYRPPLDYIIRNAALDKPVGNHALVAVGHGVAEGEPAILVRNSWGESWGDKGHAWVTESYLKFRLLNIAVPFV